MVKFREFVRRNEAVLSPVLLFVLTFAVHMVIGSGQEMLHMSHDELGVLGCAAYLTGEDWSGLVSHIGYYGYGSALLYVPIFLITKGPFLRYRLIVALNSCLMSLIPLAARRICIHYLDVDRKYAFIFSLTVGLYPGYLLYSRWTWNETMLCLLPWCMMLLLLRLYRTDSRKQRILPGMGLAAVLVYSYAVHSRSAALIAAAAFLILLVLLCQRRLIVEPVSFLATFFVLFLSDKGAKRFFMENLWLSGDGSALNNTVGGSVGKLSQYMTPDGFWGLVKIAGGQLCAANASTYGLLSLLLLCIPLMIKGCSRKRSGDAQWLLETGTFLFAAAAWATGALFLGIYGSASSTRGDYFLYTRYCSNTLGLVLLAVLVRLGKTPLKKWQYAAAAGIYAVLTLPLLRLDGLVNAQEGISNATILNLVAYLGDNPRDYVSHAFVLNLVWVCTAVFIWALAFSRHRRILCGILCCVFLHNYLVTGKNVILANSRADKGYVHTAMHVLSRVPDLPEQCPEVYYYDVHLKQPWSSSALQFALPDYRVTELDFPVETPEDVQRLMELLPENCILISTEDLPLSGTDLYRLDEPCLNRDLAYIWCGGTETAAAMEAGGIALADPRKE